MLTCVNLKQEWLEANSYTKQYQFIKKYLTTPRLKRLFAFNCAKLPEVYNQLTDPRSINALEVLDKYLDGKATEEELIKARDEAWEAYYATEAAAYYAVATSAAAYYAVATSAAARAAAAAAAAAAEASAAEAAAAAEASAAAWAVSAAAASNQPKYQSEILIKLLRPEWEFNPNWLTEVTKSLAIMINDEKRNDLSPILADALEDSGCDNQELLGYLRNSDELIKGDWIIDHLLNKR